MSYSLGMFGPMYNVIVLAVSVFWVAVIWGIVWAIRKIGK